MCDCTKIMGISGKCSDLSFATFEDVEGDGYVPYDVNVGGGDYIEFSVCIECGKMEGKWPLDPETVKENIGKM